MLARQKQNVEKSEYYEALRLKCIVIALHLRVDIKRGIVTGKITADFKATTVFCDKVLSLCLAENRYSHICTSANRYKNILCH